MIIVHLSYWFCIFDAQSDAETCSLYGILNFGALIICDLYYKIRTARLSSSPKYSWPTADS